MRFYEVVVSCSDKSHPTKRAILGRLTWSEGRALALGERVIDEKPVDQRRDPGWRLQPPDFELLDEFLATGRTRYPFKCPLCPCNFALRRETAEKVRDELLTRPGWRTFTSDGHETRRYDTDAADLRTLAASL